MLEMTVMLPQMTSKAFLRYLQWALQCDEEYLPGAPTAILHFGCTATETSLKTLVGPEMLEMTITSRKMTSEEFFPRLQ
jgi:hypothetical protein